MSTAALEARRLALIRFEYAAGTAFGCDEESGETPVVRAFVTTTMLALATLATAVAATITYLV